MRLKPTEHIIMFVEKNDDVLKVFDDFGSSIILKMIRCDYIFFVDHLDVYDFYEIVCGVLMKGLIYSTANVTFKKVKHEEGMTVETIQYIRADGMPPLD